MHNQHTDHLTMLEEPVGFYHESKKILLVDNDMASYYLVDELLRDYEVKLIHATCGYSAIRLFIENAFVDAVITEIKVPRLDGFGILKEVKTMNPIVPVIAQTACEYRGMRQKCLAAGFDEYIFMGIIKEYVLHSVGRN